MFAFKNFIVITDELIIQELVAPGVGVYKEKE